MGIKRNESKNVNWVVRGRSDPQTLYAEDDTQILKALLMDQRDELQALNRVMQCANVMAGFVALQSIDRTLKRIDRRLAKKVPLR